MSPVRAAKNTCWGTVIAVAARLQSLNPFMWFETCGQFGPPRRGVRHGGRFEGIPVTPPDAPKAGRFYRSRQHPLSPSEVELASASKTLDQQKLKDRDLERLPVQAVDIHRYELQRRYNYTFGSGIVRRTKLPAHLN